MTTKAQLKPIATATEVTYKVPTNNVPKMVRRLRALGRRALKLGFPPTTWTLSSEVTSRDTITNEDGSGGVAWTSKTLVTVTGEGPVLDGGWKLMAVVEPASKDRNLVLVVPGVKDFDAGWYVATPMSRCDHCQTKRIRGALFVVEDENEQRSVVGRTCLKDFTGHDHPESIVAWAAMWSEVNRMSEYEEGEEGGSGGDSGYLDTAGYLARVAACIRVDGWTSKGAAEARCISSTSADALDLGTKPRNEEQRQWNDARRPTDADHKTSSAAVAWAAGLGGRLSDFEENIKTLAGTEYFKARRSGLVAAIVFAYLRHAEEIKRREKSAIESVYLGTVKERSTWAATFTGMSSFDGAYGATYLCRFIVEGSEVVWWASRNPELEVGTDVLLTGTVKGHALFRGVRQTTLTRCKTA